MNVIAGIKNRFEDFGMYVGFPMIESCHYADFPKKVPRLFELAKKEILISTTLAPQFYDDEKVKNSLKGAIDRGVDVEILVDKGGHDLSNVKWLYDYCKEKKIKVYNSEINVPHIIVVDEKHVREETYHKINEINDAENDIIFNAGIIATLNRKILKKWMKEGTEVCV